MSGKKGKARVKKSEDKPFDCPFCGAKDAFYDSDQWSMGFCPKCRKFVIVLTAGKPLDPLPEATRNWIHQMFCEAGGR